MSRAPGSTIPHHGVEDRKQLPHARHQCHLLGSHLEAVVLGDEHLQELASSGEDRLQSLGFLVRKDARTRAYCGRQTGEYFGVYLVGLGQPTGGFGEVSGLAGVYDRNGDLYRSYGSRRGALVTTACFEDDQRRACLEEPIEEGLDTCLVVGDDEVFALWYEADVEALFGDVY